MHFSYCSPFQGFFHLFSASSDLAKDAAVIYSRGFSYRLSHQPLVEEVYYPRDYTMLILGHLGLHRVYFPSAISGIVADITINSREIGVWALQYTFTPLYIAEQHKRVVSEVTFWTRETSEVTCRLTLATLLDPQPRPQKKLWKHFCRNFFFFSASSSICKKNCNGKAQCKFVRRLCFFFLRPLPDETLNPQTRVFDHRSENTV